jgi:hypothetical protein
MNCKQETIKLIKSLIDYDSNTQWGKALQYAVSKIENTIGDDVTKEEIEELVESFVEVEHVYYGMSIYCIMDNKTERLSNELFELVSRSNGVANNCLNITHAE